MPDIDLRKQVARDGRGRFGKGGSGNPGGRTPGTRNQASRMAELLLDGEAAALTRKAVELALGGDGMALRLCLDRILAPRRERAVALALPKLRDAGDLGAAMAAIAAAVAEGGIAPGEAAQLAQMVETFVRAVETSDFDRRLRALEEAQLEGAPSGNARAAQP